MALLRRRATVPDEGALRRPGTRVRCIETGEQGVVIGPWPYDERTVWIRDSQKDLLPDKDVHGNVHWDQPTMSLTRSFPWGLEVVR